LPLVMMFCEAFVFEPRPAFWPRGTAGKIAAVGARPSGGVRKSFHWSASAPPNAPANALMNPTVPLRPTVPRRRAVVRPGLTGGTVSPPPGAAGGTGRISPGESRRAHRRRPERPPRARRAPTDLSTSTNLPTMAESDTGRPPRDEVDRIV